jgi:hypothetical protein
VRFLLHGWALSLVGGRSLCTVPRRTASADRASAGFRVVCGQLSPKVFWIRATHYCKETCSEATDDSTGGSRAMRARLVTRAAGHGDSETRWRQAAARRDRRLGHGRPNS